MQDTVVQYNGKKPMSNADVQSRVTLASQYVIVRDNQPHGPIFIPSYFLDTTAQVSVDQDQSSSSARSLTLLIIGFGAGLCGPGFI